MAKYRTPLRYPGGKQKLTPFIREIILANDLEGGHYVEPYAGGAGVAMELLVDGVVGHVHLNDSSYHIYALWNSMMQEPEAFCQRVSRAALNITEWRRQREIFRAPNDHDEIDVGFATFYLNRTNRSGVLTGGVIGGLAQTGQWKMDARFSRLDLIRRIEIIVGMSANITVSNLDAEEYFSQKVPDLPQDALIYCDPPYFEKASRLYLNHYAPDDHARIASMIRAHENRNWIVSYDGVPQILDYYNGCRQFLYELQYNASRAYKGSEVFIFADNLLIPRSSNLPYIAAALEANSRSLQRAVR